MLQKQQHSWTSFGSYPLYFMVYPYLLVVLLHSPSQTHESPKLLHMKCCVIECELMLMKLNEPYNELEISRYLDSLHFCVLKNCPHFFYPFIEAMLWSINSHYKKSRPFLLRISVKKNPIWIYPHVECYFEQVVLDLIISIGSFWLVYFTKFFLLVHCDNNIIWAVTKCIYYLKFI